ncbi:MAG: PSD1 domain-containing protein [Phycisphaerae bacterium]|nr:PSD1 domain-containing protein [Phycisphaerae bacterium]
MRSWQELAWCAALSAAGVGLVALGFGWPPGADVGTTVGVGVDVLVGAGADGNAPAKVDPDEPGETGPGFRVSYGRDIRPILSDRCFKCHGQDPGSRRAELRLDDRESVTRERENGRVVVAGKPDASLILERVSSHDPDEVMPPPSAGKKALTEEERALVRRWIAEGAEYEPHWAFVAPARGGVPKVKDAGWVRNEIDAHVLAALEAAGLSPSAPADSATLARRVYLDLTGLPPTPEEIDAFVKDATPEAFETLVLRLFTEEPYRTRTAERLTMPWLDQARYADTNGIHMDAGRQMWLWRDWVINAFRDNMPYDRFIVEQLAGDLIPDATVSQKIASGFNRNHVATDEGGAIPEEYLVEYAAERTATTSSVLLGLTMNCVRCHDHKFDPLKQDDYYAMFSFFNSVEEPGLYSQLPDAQRAFEPFLVVPTDEQVARRGELSAALADLKTQLETPSPEEDAQRERFFAELPATARGSWAGATLVSAIARGGGTLAIQPDQSVLATGENPNKDEFTLVYRTDATGLNAVALEALLDPSMVDGRIGRAHNGNAVLSRLLAKVTSIADPSQSRDVVLTWAWADFEQGNGDYRVAATFHPTPAAGWAVGGHDVKEDRVALFRASEAFGYEGGSEVTITLSFDSQYDKHTFGRVRATLGSLGEADLLPAALGSWHRVGPFMQASTEEAYTKHYGPEDLASLDRQHDFGGGLRWMYPGPLADGVVSNSLFGGAAVTYLGRIVHSPSARSMTVSLGSDDGFQLFVNGAMVAENRTDRGAAADQDKATFELRAGENLIVMKVVNTGGPGGFFFRVLEDGRAMGRDLVAGLTPPSARTEARTRAMQAAWKMQYSTRYRDLTKGVTEREQEIAALDAAAPKTMVMKELATPRETFVLKRGEYDKPDRSRPATRGVPAALGRLPEGAPLNRLGLANWIVSAENPLTARVIVNRVWEMLLGQGIVRTTEDFGYQGEWPSHPALLDALAVEFREGGWDMRRLLTKIITSSTYRQSSRVRAEALAKDPENKLLAYFPRVRLSAEQIRDQALYVSGLLVEKAGGPSVKPYQPEGLWQEVAMLQSNTRIYERGKGDDLWRRSMYTYWKRAAPPPTMLTFDAPTRESCVVRRLQTSTPLQALALWNDEQFVEASRMLAQRTLKDGGSDGEKLARLLVRCTGRPPLDADVEKLAGALEAFRARFRASPEDAGKILSVGMAPRAGDLDPSELAAWTMICNAALNLDASITRG